MRVNYAYRNTATIKTYGYLIAIELEDGAPTSLEAIRDRLAGAATFMEGTGKIDCELLGVVDCYPEDSDKVKIEYDGLGG